MRRVRGPQQVARLAARAERDEEVIRLAERINLPRKDFLVAIVVGDCGQN